MDPEVKITDEEVEEFIKRVPLCRDCKWRRTTVVGREFAKCHHPLVISPGSEEGSYCAVQRKYHSTECGPFGKLFEPKEKWSLRFNVEWQPLLMMVSFIILLALIVWAGVRK